MTQTDPHPKLQHASDDFLAEIMPDWLKRASPSQLDAFRNCLKARQSSQRRLGVVLSGLIPLETFAKARLEEALAERMTLTVDLANAVWREERRKLKISFDRIETFESYFVSVPALQKLLQNFKENESFFDETALVAPARSGAGETERVLSRQVDEIVRLCREVDVGRAYQVHLEQTFSNDLQALLREDKRLELELVSQIAALRNELEPFDLVMLRQVVNGQPPRHPRSLRVRSGQLSVLDCRVDGTLAFELLGSWGNTGVGLTGSNSVQGVILYLPDDPLRPLRHFSSWDKANQALLAAMADPAYRRAFERRIGLRERGLYLSTLGKRLADDKPDLQLSVSAIDGRLFDGLASEHLQRIKDDAAVLAVPTALVDVASSAQRLQILQATGLTVLNLVSAFVPEVGDVLRADFVRYTLDQVYEGAAHWSQGHQHEALEHLLGVAQNVAITAAVAAGATLVKRSFDRSAFVEGLEPVTTESGMPRLWSNDLAPYRERSATPALSELDNGLLTDGTGHWWRHDDALYPVRLDDRGNWRLVHQGDERTFGPALVFNGERAWRLVYERPMEWQGAVYMLARLWPRARVLDAERVAQILKVADIDEDYLRGLLVETRVLPVTLRDTLERFAVDARIEAFFRHTDLAQLDSELWQWCKGALGIEGTPPHEQIEAIREHEPNLRERMLDHFSRQYLPHDPLVGVIKRDFPGLPDAYAVYLLQQATAEQRQRLHMQSRIPLALAEQARSLQQAARLTRMRETLYLQSSYGPDMVELVFALLRRHGIGPGTLNLELREGSDTGRVLQRLYPQQGAQEEATILVRRDGYFTLYDGAGRELQLQAAEPRGLFEVLVACLPASSLRNLGWTGTEAPQRMRSDLQAWLPSGRQALLRLVGMREIKPLAVSMNRLPDGRFGYLLSGRGALQTTPRNMLRRRMRCLYPILSDAEIDRFLDILLTHPESAFSNLLRREQEWQQLDNSLRAWEMQVPAASRGARQQMADALRRSWRFEGERLYDAQGVVTGIRLRVVGVPVQVLPQLPVDGFYEHIIEMVLVGLGVEHLPDDFLRHFPSLHVLNLNDNALRTVPANIAWLNDLHTLRLAHNQIRLTLPAVHDVRDLPQLQILDLSFNPLGLISLQFSRHARLREVNVRHTGLLMIPTGLERCALLEHADLRDNQISTLPQALLDAPVAFRRRLAVSGNPLPVAIRERVGVFEPGQDQPPAAGQQARQQWLSVLDTHAQQGHAALWDALRAESGSDDFFQLLGELVGSRDFRDAREDLGQRVWGMIEAAHNDGALRGQLFNMAAEPRTCVDSVISCFSHLEVRMYVAQGLGESAPGEGGDTRLRLARSLFRLDQVERLARADIQARYAEIDARGLDNEQRLAARRGIDEVEINLAYRIGLATELSLPGQPRSMQFGAIAGVTRQQLDQVATEVRRAQASDALAGYISQLDFWIEHLRALHPAEFADIDSRFAARMDALYDARQATEDGVFLTETRQLADDRQRALDELALNLTRRKLSEQPHNDP